MADAIENPGTFYLGEHYDLSARKRVGKTNLSERPQSGNSLLHYDAKDLTTHAVCVGMTGSGKTGLCLALLEEAALDGVPVIAIDPKGDVGNLLLAFPDLLPTDFRPWIDEAEATRLGISPDELAEKTAKQWREGLASWGEDGQRIGKYRDSVDLAIYTPGSSAGLPISVLRSFDAPPKEILEDSDLLRDRTSAAVSGLLTLVGIDADPIKSREFILIAQILTQAWHKGENVDLPSLVQRIQDPGFDRIGAVELDAFYPKKNRTELAMQLNNLLASPSFASWMEGEPLNIANLLHTAEGKPRVSILSIAHLSEAERMFFVTILLNELLSWVRTQSGTSSLRAIFYMDEVFGYFPPTANPPSKKPMLTLLKQARAFGLGIVLATQNPVDLDYKGLSNAGTWFLGRLQTERDKARVLEGLEGASAAAGSTFNRAQMDTLLSGLGKRVFLLNNVHEDQPVVFETRWCLSYLRGPLTRVQIQTLMASRKAGIAPTQAAAEVKADPPLATTPGERPLLTTEIAQVFLAAEGAGQESAAIKQYRPTLLVKAQVRFADSKSGVNAPVSVTAMLPVGVTILAHPWDDAAITDSETDKVSYTEQPLPGYTFAPLPKEMTKAKNYSEWSKELTSHLFRDYKLELWQSPGLKQYSQPGESEADFRTRIAGAAREACAQQVGELKRDYAAKMASFDKKITQSEARAGREKSQFWSRLFEAVLGVLGTVTQIASSRKWTSQRNVSTTRSTASKASRVLRERQEAAAASSQLEELREQRQQLDDEQTERIKAIEAEYKNLPLQKYVLAPRKSDIQVQRVYLAWKP